ncbi:hypothetical protein F2Q70_00011407 [Brassica cretica]|uniref:Uncharacterized protein n=1 Tax=Brassica cretica TaxID=69181 RepID=A0A8S9LVZ7_BRACR|nr:hypothetical protein F2Q70_00011407 [Brassica cretica]KAF3551140.1 hypothetical protein DY000_02006644 [Brassica cretica]
MRSKTSYRGYKVSVVPKNITEKLRLVIEAPMFKLTPADVSSKSPLGIVNNLEVKVWNSMVFIDFMCWRWNIYAYSFWKKVSSYNGDTTTQSDEFGEKRKRKRKKRKKDQGWSLVDTGSSDLLK